MTRVTIKVLRILLIRVRSPTPVVALKSAACSPRRLLPFFAWLYCITLAFCCQTHQNRLFPLPFKVHISAPTLPLERFILFSKANSHCRTDISQPETPQPVLKNFSRKIERRFPYRSAFFCKMSSFSVSFLLSVDQCQNEDSDSGNQNHFCHVQNQVHIHKIHPPFSKMHVFKII